MQPEVFRKTGKRGQPTGSFFAEIDGKEVNLWTTDRAKAKKMAAEKRRAAVDRAAVEAFTTPAPTPEPKPEPKPEPATSTETPHTNGANAAGGWAADLNGAAAGDAGAAGDDAAIDLEDLDLDELVQEGAKMLVEIQIQAQAAVWRNKKGIEVGEVPEGHLTRARGEMLYRVFLRRIMPKTVKVPTWSLPIAAIIMVASQTTPEQLRNARAAGAPAPPATADPRDPIDVEVS